MVTLGFNVMLLSCLWVSGFIKDIGMEYGGSLVLHIGEAYGD